jgi:hypothetical protein
MTNASPHGYGWLGWILCYEYRRYDDGYRFGQLAVDLVDTHGFDVDPAKVQYAMGLIVSWMRPLAISIDFFRAAFRSGAETGDLIYATYAASEIVIRLILTGVALDEVWRESERLLEFSGKIGFRDATDMIVTQQLFIAAMRGRTSSVSTFSDAPSDERAFEAELTADRMPIMVARYWILKIGARFLSGDYALALEAVEKAKQLLWATPGEIHLLDYHFYSALTLASLAATNQPEQRSEWLTRVNEHWEQLRQWMQGAPALKIEISTPCARTSAPFARRARTVPSRTRASPMNWPRSSMRRAASIRLRTSICGTPATAICAGAPKARCGS